MVQKLLVIRELSTFHILLKTPLNKSTFLLRKNFNRLSKSIPIDQSSQAWFLDPQLNAIVRARWKEVSMMTIDSPTSYLVCCEEPCTHMSSWTRREFILWRMQKQWEDDEKCFNCTFGFVALYQTILQVKEYNTDGNHAYLSTHPQFIFNWKLLK